MNKHSITNNKCNQGFILVATIWMLAAASILAGAFAVWVERNLKIVSEQSNYTDSSLDMIGTKSTLLYMLSTQRKNQAGLVLSNARKTQSKLPKSFFDPMSFSQAPVTGSEIRLDGRPYIGLHDSFFALQDVAGLININSPSSVVLHSLLLKLGYSEREKNGLIDKLADYIDHDDLNRIKGAERYHYEKLGLSPPPNKKLKSPFELANVMGWRKVIDKHPDILNSLTAGNAFLLNINTANRYALTLLPGIDHKLSEILIQARQNQPFTSLSNAGQKIGLNLDNLYASTTTSASRFTRLHLWYKNSRLIEHFGIQLTPTSKTNRPWKINSSYALPPSLENDHHQPIKPQTNIFDSAISTVKN